MNTLTRAQQNLILNREEVTRAWIAQIRKDLGMQSGNDPDPLWNEVRAWVESYLDDRFGRSQEGVPDLLYRIDLDETALPGEMASGEWSSYHLLLAEMIMRREAVKVLFRFQYSGRI